MAMTETSSLVATPTSFAEQRSRSSKKTREGKERVIEWLLFLAAFSAVATTVAIVVILLYEGWSFFAHVSLKEFFTHTQWTPLFAKPEFGVLPLLTGTFVIAFIAILVAVPLGLLVAIYLSEFAPYRVRETVKPFLELLEGVPTIVYGYFALLFVTPLLQKLIPGLSGFNMLSPGIVIGIMITPYVASVSEDAMRAVPMALREASYAMGATRWQTATKVVLPAATSGVVASFILGISRAVGETMVVAIAAGQQPNFTFDPREPAATITAYIGQVAMGDLPHGSIGYQSIFAVGLVLMAITLLFNIIGQYIRNHWREVY
jgi:phosphate transport system permease protein